MASKMAIIRFPPRHFSCFCLELAYCVAQKAWPSVVDSLRMARLLAPLLLLTAAARAVNISCQIFEETMVCDSEKESVHRGEIRTCSG